LINIAVPGVSGRMGAAIAEQILDADDLKLALATVRTGNPMAGKKFSDSNVTIATTLNSASFDVLIDFTLPIAVLDHVAYCVENKIPMVIGATGFSEQQLKTVQQAAKQIPIVMSANMSLGVNICYKLLAMAAKLFDKDWDVSILDEHHKHKKDSPSGTAKEMAQILAEQGDRDPKEINIYSERQGETVGTHTITFANPDELLVISHIAENRDIFAKGAVTAARWLVGRPVGLYSMQDVVA
jgi:4-hydroxy-tetrahydrodipicolinate reductase